jgi:Na+/H+-dicarboxylate symporter/ABC-type amino acid transport substrate-binding protein
MKITLPFQILIALVLAVAAGIFFGELTAPLIWIGDAFIMLLKMSILPYLAFALMSGIATLDVKQAKQLVKYGGFFLVIIWAVVIVTLYLLTYSFPAQEVIPFYSPTEPPAITPKTFLDLFIPNNIFHALSNNIVPAVVVFSLFFGAALMVFPRKEALLAVFDSAVNALGKIITWIVRLSPIGIFALIAATTGTISVAQFQKIAVYLITFLAASLLFTFWLLPAIVTSFTRVKYRELISNLQAALLLGFSTGNIFVTLPFLIDGINKIAKNHQIRAGEAQTISKTLTPIAYNLPLVGNLMAILFVFFLAYFYGIQFSIAENAKLIPIAILTLAGPVTAGLNAMVFLVNQMELPTDGISLFVETLAITRNLQGLAGSAGIGVFTLLTLFAFTRQVHFRLGRLLINGFLSILLVVGVIVGLHAIDPRPSIPKPLFPTLTIDNPSPAKLFLPGETFPPPSPLQEGETRLERIRRTNILRVGYNPDTIPFAYFNDAGQLVGYDIDFAHQLSRNLGVELIFIPLHYDDLIHDLESDLFDIGMSAITVTDRRLTRLKFSTPTTQVESVFVVRDFRRLDFGSLHDVLNMKDLRLAVLAGSSFERLARVKFPHAEIVPITDYTEFAKDDTLTALLWTNEEALVWVQSHPFYTVVLPEPHIHTEFYAYAMNQEADDFLEYVNYWLSLKNLDGFTKEARDKWILGERQIPTRRWSILRNVLHW